MVEQESETPKPGSAADAPPALAASPSKKLATIPARRLANSPACLNCGTDLKGPFCYYCGQPDKNLMRFFPALLRDLLEDVIDLDSRAVRTIKPLLFHPGKLTRDYLDGRRFRYVPPMRLYMFASMAFFILATILTSNLIVSAEGPDGPGDGFQIRVGDSEDLVAEELQKAMDEGSMSEAEAKRVEEQLARALEFSKVDSGGVDPSEPASAEDDENEDKIIIDGKEWDRETNPFILPGVPDFINDWINDEIEESPKKGREIEENPDLIVDKMFDVLPFAVFLMLPLVALLFKFWYLFARKYYVEHLIFSLHNHAFLFVIFILSLLINTLAAWLDPTGTGQTTENATVTEIILLSWIPLYLLISLKTVYRQGWFLTLAKFSVIGISYMVLLVSVTSAAAILSFVLL